MTRTDSTFPVVSDNKLVGISDGPQHPFVVSELRGELNPLPAAASPRKPKPIRRMKGKLPEFADAKVLSDLTIVSDELVGLFEQYGVPLTVDLSPDVFTYESGLVVSKQAKRLFPEAELDYSQLRRFRFGRLEEMSQLRREFDAFLEVWFDANLRNVNPRLGVAEIYLIHRLYLSFVDKFAPELPVDDGLYIARRYALSTPEKARQGLSFNPEYESLMEKFEYHHVW